MSKTSEKRARRADARRKQQPKLGFLRENQTLLIGGGIVLLFIVVAILIGNVIGSQQPAATSTAAVTPAAVTTPGATPKEVAVPSLGANHVQPGAPHIAYNSNPPTSGPHYDSPALWGSKAALPPERWLHNLEHGGIAALYNCPQGCPDITLKLEQWLKTGPQSKYGYMKMVMLPYDQLPSKLAFAAWSYYILLDDWNEPVIREFFRSHQDNGPEDIP